ncbi:putative non-specific serine/threonine protein kinase [Medicago truncatula]|uniref:Putative non-specific serine/threonine protein kinase n=1 Tax=Medicago truncatula TaxID=3880 RepID=A0A396H030_MEDTR|nr:putative non-specific serine/threonine protein kinase [Medicago truncatula]
MPNSINKKFHTKITLLSIYLVLFPLVINSYNPDYNLAINCGSSTNNVALDKRIWIGDNIDNSNLFTFIEPKTTNPSFKSSPNSLSNIQIPFTTAHISFSNFTYSFSSIPSSPVFIRLHFYPTSYQNFDPSNALFSVEVNNNLTLLKNFSPSLWLHDEVEKITKEYCIQIKPNGKLNITFFPNNINELNPFYAFVNGIEVVSMPSFLYYTNPDDLNYYFKLIGFDNREYEIRNDKALEMVYRVNVGENQVQPSDDTGMFRNWDNDFPRYLEKEYPLSVSSFYGSDHLNYLNNTIPNYTAPEAVYLTARSYGKYVTEDYNVTWNFEVDSSFTYMVRLHFCEFDLLTKNKGDRVFQIFINDILAEPNADVIRWSGGNMIPVHKDYAVKIYSQNGSSEIERVNLSIKLQRLPAVDTTYRDTILNGIEIFKVSDKNNLAGMNPNKPMIIPTSPKHRSKSKKSTTFMVAVVGVSCLLLAFLLVVRIIAYARRRRRRRFESNLQMEESSWKTNKEGSSTLPSHLCRYFTIAEIREATNNFEDIFIIGAGGFGNVYKGYINGLTPVAIKRRKPGSR